MKEDANNGDRIPVTNDVKDQESQHDHRRIQEELVDREGKDATSPEKVSTECSFPESGDLTLGCKMDIGLSPLEGIRLLPNIRPPYLPKLGIANSLIRPPVTLRLFDSPQLDVANAFPSLFGGIAEELAKSLRLFDPVPSLLDQLQLPNLVLGIEQELQSILRPILRPFPPLVHPRARIAAKLGWVVHRTLPTTVLEDAAEDDLDETIMTYYRERWAEIHEEIALATSGYLVDQDSKETMIQALSAHEHGLYRLVPRAMVTGIERAARIQLHEKLVDRGLNVKETILGEVDDLPVSWFHDLSSGTIQYETLEKHLYEHIDDENDRSQFAESPIPNRHAAVHGLVPYASEKSSLNSIFLTDFVFLMITQIKREKITEIAEILKDYTLAAESKE